MTTTINGVTIAILTSDVLIFRESEVGLLSLRGGGSLRQSDVYKRRESCDGSKGKKTS